MAATDPMAVNCHVKFEQGILFRSVSAGAPEHLSLHTGENTMHFHGQALVPVHLRRKLVTIYFLAVFMDKLRST
jgi:hypothetical protein